MSEHPYQKGRYDYVPQKFEYPPNRPLSRVWNPHDKCWGYVKDDTVTMKVRTQEPMEPVKTVASYTHVPNHYTGFQSWSPPDPVMSKIPWKWRMRKTPGKEQKEEINSDTAELGVMVDATYLFTKEITQRLINEEIVVTLEDQEFIVTPEKLRIAYYNMTWEEKKAAASH